MLLRALTAIAAPAGARARLSAFYFHRVLEAPDPLLPFEPDARMFDRMLAWIGAQFRVLEPLEACERLYAGTLPARAAVISFDDGYRDNYTVALPILQSHGMRAVFFVATGYLEGGIMFNDRVIEAIRRYPRDRLDVPAASSGMPTSVPLGTVAERRAAIDTVLKSIKHLEPEVRSASVERLEQQTAGSASSRATPIMMDDTQVRALHRAGMRIGGHTRSHPILVKLADDDAYAEIEGGLADLAAISGERPWLFAYPNGRRGSDFDSRHVAMLEKAGVRYAFTTHAGAGTADSPRHELPRFTPWDRTGLRFGVRSLLNLMGGR